MDAIEPAPRSRSGRTNCRKDQQPYRLQAAKNQASWYCSSWRGLQSDASTPDDSRLNTPETTPPSFPTNSATAPSWLGNHNVICYLEVGWPDSCPKWKYARLRHISGNHCG